MGKLIVKVIAGRNIHNPQMLGGVDPYVTVKCENNTFKTDVCDNSSTPTWNSRFAFQVADENSAQITFVVWNSNLMSDDHLGEYTLSCSGLVRGKTKDKWYLLKQSKSNAEIRVSLFAEDFGSIPSDSDESEAPAPAPAPVPAPAPAPVAPPVVVAAPPPPPPVVYAQPAPPPPVVYAQPPPPPPQPAAYGYPPQPMMVPGMPPPMPSYPPGVPPPVPQYPGVMPGMTPGCSRPGCPFQPHPTQGHGFCCYNCRAGRPHGPACQRVPRM